MTAYVLTDAQGVVVSMGTVLASPLPAGLTANPISDADFDAIRAGLKKWLNGSVVATNLLTQQTNTADLNAKLTLLLSEAAAAITSLQTIRDRADLAAGTLSSAVLSNAARQLQADSKTQAMLQQAHMRRTVAIARLLTGAVDSVTDT